MTKRPSILDRVIKPSQGDLAEALAQYILSLDFPKSDHERYARLSERAQDGLLSADEKSELEEFLNVNDFLSTVQAKARSSLCKSVTSVA